MFKYVDKNLHLNKWKLNELVEKHGTPLYVYDLNWLDSRFQHMRSALSDRVDIHYAMKANSHPKVLAKMSALGANVDIVSAGEMKRALENGFEGSQVIFSGVAKRKSEIEFALANGIGQFNVESFEELKNIESIAASMDKVAPIALRMNPDVNPQTHPYITTGFRENKFGIEPQLLPRIIDVLKRSGSLKFIGLSMHIGSQLLELESLKDAVKKIIEYQGELDAQGLNAERMDLGGGLGIFYDRQDEAGEVELMVKWADIINAAQRETGLKIQVEPGRWLVGHMGALLTEIVYSKKTEFKKFLIVDTGMHHLLRPALYQAYHEIWPLVESAAEKTQFDIVGPICESSDVLGRDRILPQLESGDILSVSSVGAYGACLASRYNLHELPKEIALEA